MRTTIVQKTAVTTAVTLALGLAALLPSAWGQAVRDDEPTTGQITLLIGEAVVARANGERLMATRGLSIKPGDQIDTTSGGHVHVRFVDGALVSVRPDSLLTVEEYRYTAKAVGDSVVRFRLQRGMARAISGAAAEGAKDRFRLNTPLVAIGVRGTDFVVNSEPNRTAAFVNQGAIVMSPFGEACAANTLGPCITPSAQLISANMGNLTAEYLAGTRRPELRRFAESSDVMVASVAGEQPNARVPLASAPQSGADSRASAPGAAAAPAKGDALVAQKPPAADSVVLLGTAAESEAPHVIATLMEDLVTKQVTSGAFDISRQLEPLAWGRWSGPATASDFIMPLEDAKQGREVTVGSFGYLLYRSPAGGPALNLSGQFDFQLGSSQAQFSSAATGVLPATVTGGQLAVDFGRREFSTQLGVFSSATGPQTVAGGGKINDNGMFAVAIPGGKIAGAAAFDGNSVGYLFDKAVASGVLSGVTLWNR